MATLQPDKIEFPKRKGCSLFSTVHWYRTQQDNVQDSGGNHEWLVVDARRQASLPM